MYKLKRQFLNVKKKKKYKSNNVSSNLLEWEGLRKRNCGPIRSRNVNKFCNALLIGNFVSQTIVC